MKALTFFTLAFFLGVAALSAQTPQSFRYQAVARDNSGNVLSNQAVSFRIGILSGSVSGTVVYSEIHTGLSTNAFGLVELEIGKGTPVNGMFSSIDWGSNSYFVKIEMDPAGGSTYQVLSTSQLLSVPYALYSQKAGNGFSGNYNDLTNKPLLFDGTWLSLSGKPAFATVATSGSYTDLLNKPVLFDGAWNSLTGRPTTLGGYGITDAMNTSHVANGITSTMITNWNSAFGWGNHSGLYKPLGYFPSWTEITAIPAGFADGTDNVDDADNSTTNEIQVLSLTGNNLSLSKSGGTVTIPGDNWGTQTVVSNATLEGNGLSASPLKIAQQSAGSGQVLKWTGSTWAPADDAFALPYSGTGTSGSPLFNIVNLGTSGAISTLSNGNYAIWGESASSTGIGVYGVNKTSTGTTYGVFGDVYSSTGYSGYFQGGRFYIQGNTGIGAPNPGAKLEVAGQVKITGGSPGAGKILTSDGSGLASWVSPTVTWLKNGNNVYYSSGNVGIGLNNPTGMMEIYGNSVDSYPTLLLSETDGFSRVSFRTMSASNKHWVLAGHTNLTDATSQLHLNYFNGSAGKNIFSVYGDSNIGFDGNVGIGTQSPGAKLDVAGQVKITGGNPGTGKVLTSDAVGLASWQTPVLSPWLKNGSDLYYNSGNVAIGMTFPRYKLTIYEEHEPHIGFYNSTSGTSGTDGFTISTGSSGSPVWIWNWEYGNMHFGTDNANRMVINADGQVDIMNLLNINSDVSWGAALKVNGNQALWWDGTYFSWGYGGQYNYFADAVTIKSAGVPGYDLVVNGSAAKTGGGSWSNLSDARLKNITGNYKKGLSEIIALQPVIFTYKEGNPRQISSVEQQVGFVAQDVQKVFPEAVNEAEDGYLDFNMHSVNVALVNAVKELKAELILMKAENERLKKQNENFNTRLEQMEALTGYNADK